MSSSEFANLVKAVADRHVPVAIVFCAIGASLDELFSAHPSAHRYFHAVSLERLAWDPRLEIIDNAAEALGIEIDDTTRYRIAKVSDGFPHYIHLVCEKLFWKVFGANNGLKVVRTSSRVLSRMPLIRWSPSCVSRTSWRQRKYTNDCEPILWAVADSDEFHRASRDVYQSYERIMADLNRSPLIGRSSIQG